MRPSAQFLVCICAMVWIAAATSVVAQQYPNRRIRLVVPYPPGGGTDLVARLVGQKLFESSGHGVVVENRAGAGGVLGTEVVAKSAPDGYTLVLGTQAAFAVNPSLIGKMPYDPLKDFSPVTLNGIAQSILVVHPSVPVKTVKDLIALARANPGQLTFASSGVGNSAHLSGELFKIMAKVDMLHVPYSGGGTAIAALIGGQASLSFASMPTALPHVRSGKLRVIAVSSSKRSLVLPELPTVAESGLPGFESQDWQGILVPARTPADIVSRLNADMQRVLGLQEIKDKLLASGFEVRPSTPEWFAEFISAETIKWAKVIKGAGIKAE